MSMPSVVWLLQGQKMGHFVTALRLKYTDWTKQVLRCPCNHSCTICYVSDGDGKTQEKYAPRRSTWDWKVEI